MTLLASTEGEMVTPTASKDELTGVSVIKPRARPERNKTDQIPAARNCG